MQFRKDARFSSNARRISSTVCLHVSPRTSSSNARTRASTSLFATRSPSLLSSLTEALRNDPDTLILEVGSPNDEKALRAVQAWAKEYT